MVVLVQADRKWILSGSKVGLDEKVNVWTVDLLQWIVEICSKKFPWMCNSSMEEFLSKSEPLIFRMNGPDLDYLVWSKPLDHLMTEELK